MTLQAPIRAIPPPSKRRWPKRPKLEAVGAVTDGEVAVIDEVVADKGYHSHSGVVYDLAALELRHLYQRTRTRAPAMDEKGGTRSGL